MMEEPNIQKAVMLADEGLYCDGEHHKQWYLEEIIKALGQPIPTACDDPFCDCWPPEEGCPP